MPLTALLLLTHSIGDWSSRIWAQTEGEGVEVLTRGPVHEAFAATINFKTTEGMIVPKAPPEPIQEIPPEQRLDGDHVTWIPGYWAWDDESDGFLWVSGIWRNLPPGRQWIPGYWWDSGQGYLWIAGYWADAETDEVEYLNEPPASLEVGPNVAAPSRNHSWIPGTWRWSGSRYAWQPGYWYEPQPDWVWVPPYYTWAPQGWLFVDGYYDHDVPHRGLVFAPVRFTVGYPSRPDYYYRPSTVISLSVFTNHLFLRPRNRHYYFGDYYAPRYLQSGYFSSFNYFEGGHGYDPIYSHERWRHRDDDRWERRRRDDFEYYRNNESARPPRTWAALHDYRSRSERDDQGDRNDRRRDFDYVTRLDQLAERRDSPVRLRKVAEEEKKAFSRRGQEIRNFEEQRRKLSRRDADRIFTGRTNEVEAKKGTEEGKSVKAKMPKSPVMARAGEGTNRPPPRPAYAAGQEASGRGASPDNPPENKDRRTPKGKNEPGSTTDRSDLRRDSRVPDSQEDPLPDRNAPPIQTPPEQPTQERAQKESRQDQDRRGNRDANARRESGPNVQKEAQPRRNPRSQPTRQRETPRTSASSPQAEPRRAVPTTEKSKDRPKGNSGPVPKAKPAKEGRSDPNRTPKASPRSEIKRVPQAEGGRDGPAPRKQVEASPRPSSKPSAPAPQKPKRNQANPQPQGEERKKKAREKSAN